MGPSNKFFNYGLQFNRGKGSEWYSALGYSTTYGAKASFSPRDNLNFTLMYEQGDEDDWLNWIEDNSTRHLPKKAAHHRGFHELVRRRQA